MTVHKPAPSVLIGALVALPEAFTATGARLIGTWPGLVSVKTTWPVGVPPDELRMASKLIA